MENEQIKSAFFRVKKDMLNLENEISQIKLDLNELKILVSEIYSSLTELKYEKLAKNAYKTSINRQTDRPTDTPTIQQINPTLNNYPTDTPTVPQELKGLKTPNLTFSTGNEGVPTDRQTDRQTDQQTGFSHATDIEMNIKEATEILDSLDRLKKEIRLKFKQLTSQEMLIFSTIYELEEKDPKNNSYGKIANILNLSESSIRDYVLKIIKKGISIKKQKINNRKIILSVSPELKKIASLSTIIQLREL